MRRLSRLLCCQAGSGSDPARVAAHHLQDKNLGGGFAHGGHIQSRFPHRHGNIFRHGAKARTAVGHGQVIVNGLRDADAAKRVAGLSAKGSDAASGILGIAAAVVEEVADVVGGTYFQQALVYRGLFPWLRQLVAAGAKSSPWGVAQGGDFGGLFPADINQLFTQCSQYAVAPCQHTANLA